MDGFDDLLAPSRRALEENPFADPFTSRSISPDPWASQFANVQSTSSQSISPSLETASHLYESTSSTTTLDSNATDITSSPTSSDPLESVTRTADDDNDIDKPRGRSPPPVSPPSVRSPGFKESIPVSFSETATIRPTEPEESEPISVDSLPSSASGRRSTTPTPPISPQSQQNKDVEPLSGNVSRVVSPSPSIPRLSELVSPLEGLSLGGGSPGGWQSEQHAWGSGVDDDSDDDRPIGQTIKIPEHGNHVTRPPDRPTLPRGDGGIPPVFVITVDDPQKVGDAIRSFTMYTVHTRTTSPLYTKSAFSVLRRYSDFLWLYETLSSNNSGVVVPPVPEKNPFARFDDQFVRQRRLALQKCIQKIANHPVLGKDSDLKMFLESDTFALDIRHRKAEIAHERGGIMASIGQTIAGPRFYEMDEWFDRQKAYLDSLELQLRGLVKSIEAVAKQRADLALAMGEFAQSISDLSSSDVGKQLSFSLAGLADVERKAQDLQSTQAEQDMEILMSTVDEYARLINSVRLAFNSRIRTYHVWRTADSDLLRTKQMHERNRAQGRIPADRLGYSLSQIAEAERRAMEAKHEFDHVSKLVKSEVARFEQERIEDLKDSLHAFVEGMITRQKELISGWETYQQMLLKRMGGGGPLPNSAGGSGAS